MTLPEAAIIVLGIFMAFYIGLGTGRQISGKREPLETALLLRGVERGYSNRVALLQYVSSALRREVAYASLFVRLRELEELRLIKLHECLHTYYELTEEGKAYLYELSRYEKTKEKILV